MDDTLDPAGTGTPPSATEADGVLPNLPDSFYKARPELAHISQAAHASMTPRDAVLAAVLALAAHYTPCRVVLPPIVGGHASLNCVVVLLGDSGTGKGAAVRVAKRLIGDHGTAVSHRCREITAGTGEGLCAAYLGTEKLSTETGRSQEQLVRRYDSVLQVVNEGELLIKHGERTGSTFLQKMRSAWSGETLGDANAQARRPDIPEMSYRYAMIMGLQPGVAGPLLDDHEGGTPQRFLWASTTDPSAPAPGVAEACQPGPLRWRPPAWEDGPAELFSELPGVGAVRVLVVADGISREIREASWARLVGETTIGEYDGHRHLVRLKLAGLLAILGGRLDVTDHDWALAGQLVQTSDAVRDTAVARRRQKARQAAAVRQQDQIAATMARRAAIATDKSERIERVSNRMAALLAEHGPTATGKLRKMLAQRDRDAFKDALDEAIGDGIAVIREGRVHPVP